jgi:hypothetical protein
MAGGIGRLVLRRRRRLDGGGEGVRRAGKTMAVSPAESRRGRETVDGSVEGGVVGDEEALNEAVLEDRNLERRGWGARYTLLAGAGDRVPGLAPASTRLVKFPEPRNRQTSAAKM